jgi:restriction system protein
MPRYWVMAPVDSKPPERFNKVWQFDLANNLVSIGWHELGDVTAMSREELAAAVTSTYPDKPPTTKSLYSNMLWNFYHEIRPGDLLIARRGRKVLAAVGTVIDPAVYAPGKIPSLNHFGILGVAWQDAPRNKDFADIVFPMHTLTEITEDAFRGLVSGSAAEVTPAGGTAPPALPATEANQTEFVLEKYLEDFIVSNFDKIFRGELKIYVDDEGNDGQQYDTDVGSIDILATEAPSKSFVVIELKKGRPSDEVVGQILRYMGWVKKNLCTSGQEVKGLVICREPDQKLTYALEVASNIDVRYYRVSFSLSESLHMAAG